MDIREFNKMFNDIRHPSNDEQMFNIGITSLPHGYQYGGGAIGYSTGGLAPITAGMSIAPGYARGGYISQGEPVNTNLTRTIPPVRGPNPQGVETLFKRRYS
jgi:hypothetical protein